MRDQAEALRKKIQNNVHRPTAKTLAVVSGKGGVGKSNFSLNFAITLSKRGHKVLLFDLDIGMGNIDILLGNSPKYSIVDFLDGNKSLQNIVMEGPEQLRYIAGGSGLKRLIQLDDDLMIKFTGELYTLLEQYEYVIFDMGAGATQESLNFILSVDEIVVVTTPEPTSITDAYSMMKFIHMQDQKIPFLIVVNRALGEKDGIETYKRLQTVARKFLDRKVLALGIIPDDRAIQKAVSRQIPFILDERSNASKALIELTNRYEAKLFEDLPASTAYHFVSKLKRFLFER